MLTTIEPDAFVFELEVVLVFVNAQFNVSLGLTIIGPNASVEFHVPARLCIFVLCEVEY